MEPINHQSIPEQYLDFANKTFLITGCNGFLGRQLLRSLYDILDALSAEGKSCRHHIYSIDNGITSETLSCVLPSYVTFYSDNAIHFDYSKLKNIDYVFHLAGLASPAQYKKYPLETIDVAVVLTRTLLEHSIRWKSQFIFFSSSEIYGNPTLDYIPTPEDYKGYVSCRGPRSCYDESKRLGETLCYIYNHYYGVDTRTIRPFNVYGPGMSQYDYRMVPNLMRSLVKNEDVLIYGDGRQTRTFCYLNDAIEAILRIASLGMPGEAYNIGNNKPELSMLDLIKVAQEVTGIRSNVRLVPYPEYYPADEPLRRCPDLSKVEAHTGYRPKVSLMDGLRLTYEWSLSAYI